MGRVEGINYIAAMPYRMAYHTRKPVDGKGGEYVELVESIGEFEVWGFFGG